MAKKIIIALVLTLAAVLVFSGCDKLEQVGESVEDEIESRLDPIEDAIESKVDPIEDALESRFDPIEDAIESKVDPIEDAIESNWNSLVNNENKPTDPEKTTKPAVPGENASANGKTDAVTPTLNGITKEQARDIALQHANAKVEDARFLKVENDYDNGRRVYEVSFRIGTVEYDYEILADSGEIVKAEKDLDD